MSSSLGDLPDPTSAFNKRRLTLVFPPQREWIRIHSKTFGARIFSGAYAVSRKWSKAFMEHPDKPQGLLYNSRHNPANTNLVIFGTHPTGVPPLSSQVKASTARPLITHKELKPTLDKYEIGLMVSRKMKIPKA